MGKLMALFAISIAISVIFVGCPISPKPSPTPPEGSIHVITISSDNYGLELYLTAWPKKPIHHIGITPLSFWYRLKAKKAIKSANFFLTSPTIKGTSPLEGVKMIKRGDLHCREIKFDIGEVFSGEIYKFFVNGEVIPEEGSKEIIYECFLVGVSGDIVTEFELDNWVYYRQKDITAISDGGENEETGVKIEWWIKNDEPYENEKFNTMIRITTEKIPVGYDINSEYLNIYIALFSEDNSLLESTRIGAGHKGEIHIAKIEKELEIGSYYLYIEYYVSTDIPDKYPDSAELLLRKEIKVYTEGT